MIFKNDIWSFFKYSAIDYKFKRYILFQQIFVKKKNVYFVFRTLF